MDTVAGIIVGLIVLMILVIAHEFGHFIMSRRNGVRVLEFGIGFPPRAVAWIKDPKTHKWRKLKKSEWQTIDITKTVGVEKNANNAEGTRALASADDKKIIQDGLVFSINWLPIGGFCQMDGESAVDTRPGTFGKASFWKKTKILFAGVMMNWLVAFIIFTVLAWVGMPTFLEGQFTVDADTRVAQDPVRVKTVHEGSPAEKAGFKEGDLVLKINGETVKDGYDITAINKNHAGEEVSYTIERTIDCSITPAYGKCPTMGVGQNGKAPTYADTIDLTATLNSTDADYLLGISMESSEAVAYSTWSAPIVGAGLTLQLTGETFKGLGELVWNLVSGAFRQFSFDDATRESGREAIETVGESVTGPVGIIGVLFPSFTAAGPSNLAFLAALISVSLACMNVLPIPALDGGRWLLIGIYKLRKKKLTKGTEEKIVARAFVVLLALIVIVTVLDITRFFR
ncbi:site-2 protease family protein [Candidatus Saccharibacteria bacterium]|nr:site-2 protease family protein [Candidatus Saccharibacteria bacterium]